MIHNTDNSHQQITEVLQYSSHLKLSDLFTKQKVKHKWMNVLKM